MLASPGAETGVKELLLSLSRRLRSLIFFHHRRKQNELFSTSWPESILGLLDEFFFLASDSLAFAFVWNQNLCY